MLDFFGSMFQVKEGSPLLPAHRRHGRILPALSLSRRWFSTRKLIETDDGWLASYFDSLAQARFARQRPICCSPSE